MKCLQCKKEFIKKHLSNKFCSLSCSTTFNNKRRKKQGNARRCRHCNKIIKNRMLIDGVVKEFYNRKYCIKCSPIGQNGSITAKKYAKKRTHKKCSKCNKILAVSEFYSKHYKKYLHSLCKKCYNRMVKCRYNRYKELAIKYKGGKCIKCGYNKYIASLEFHHKNKNTKEFKISRLSHGSFEKMTKELDKCILLCANCHRELHWKDNN